jgi:hypothetical protein
MAEQESAPMLSLDSQPLVAGMTVYQVKEGSNYDKTTASTAALLVEDPDDWYQDIGGEG